MGDAATSDAAADEGFTLEEGGGGAGGRERWADWYVREWVGGKGKGTAVLRGTLLW